MIVTLSACSFFKKLGQSLLVWKLFYKILHMVIMLLTLKIFFFWSGWLRVWFHKVFRFIHIWYRYIFYINEQQQNSIKDNVLTIPFIHNLQSICWQYWLYYIIQCVTNEDFQFVPSSLVFFSAHGWGAAVCIAPSGRWLLLSQSCTCETFW